MFVFYFGPTLFLLIKYMIVGQYQILINNEQVVVLHPLLIIFHTQNQ